MSDPVQPFDLVRMFVGDQPPLFYVEIVARCVIIYLYTLLTLRWIGGRSVAQLSLVEFLLVIALGSAVGDSLFYPDVPLLHALAVITIIALINKAFDIVIIRSRLAKSIVDGDPVEAITHGRIRSETIRDRKMGPAELHSMLRIHGIRNLGEVEFAFFEPSGTLSVFKYTAPKPGLRIMPPAELTPFEQLDARKIQGLLACMTLAIPKTRPSSTIAPNATAITGRKRLNQPVATYSAATSLGVIRP
ncbi:MAG: YetF domain-containing protein [Deltaproteobacteria bacterium]